MNVLTAFAAITTCRFVGAREGALRQDDSGAKSLLPGSHEELGMRLALGKPTVIIKDDKTTYSFDTTPIEQI